MRRLIRLLVAGLLAVMVLHVDGSLAQPLNDGSRLIRVRSSLLGLHYWYQQTYRGVDVLHGGVARHVHYSGDIVTRDYRQALGRDIDVVPSVAAAVAARAAGAFLVRTDLAIASGPDPRLVWSVLTEPPTGTLRTLVDAHTGEVISVERIARDFDGTGRVFNPNPVVTLRDQSLRDQDDADYPALQDAYRIVPLTHLDGSGFLRGDFARIGYDDSLTAFSASHTFEYGRSSTFFSQTMAYYHATAAQEYIQSLGFTDVNNKAQILYPDTPLASPPSVAGWYSPATKAIYFTTNRVDGAEDADTIAHEYGHAIQDDQIPGFYVGLDDRAIGEGFADYWAVTLSQPVNGDYNVPCVGDWIAVEWIPIEPHCSSRVDRDLTVADRIFFEPHFDGQIWSRALWDMNLALGREIANTIVLESQFAFWPAITFEEAARTTVTTARRLFGGVAARVVYDAFRRRGLISPPNVAARSTHPPSRPGFREIARLWAPEPGGYGLYTFDFEPYGLDDSGNALYAADVTPWGEGVFVAGPTGARAIVRSLDPAPGGGVFGAGVLPGPSLAAAGRVALSFMLQPFRYPWGRNAGVYASSRDGVRAIVVPGVTPAPGGGTFVGSEDMAAINSSGSIAFSGMITTTHGISGTLGIGVFMASAAGAISPVAAPGDPAPGGGTFDYAAQPAMNENGDIAFTGHLAGTPCRRVSQARVIGCVRDLFLRRARAATIERVAGVGQAAPGGGVFSDIWYPVINSSGDVLFRAVLDMEDGGIAAGYFLSRAGQIIAIARSGDAMPGGGNFAAAAVQPGNWDLNDRGDVAFSATLDTFDNLLGWLGIADQGLYTWSGGVRSLVVRSGDGVPEGEVVALQPIGYLGDPIPFSGAQINNVGEILFQATVGQVVDDVLGINTILYVKK